MEWSREFPPQIKCTRCGHTEYPKPYEPDCIKLPETLEEYIDRYIHIVDNQPTAFDVDKIVEQLGNIGTLARPVGWTKAYEIIMLKDAIEIVKGGGVE